MDQLWDIDALDQQEFLIISREDERSGPGFAEDTPDTRLEIVEVNQKTHFIDNVRQAIVGSAREVLTGNKLVLASGWGSQYICQLERNLHLTGRTAFVSSDLLHEGRYIVRKVRVEFRRDPNTEDWRLPVSLPLLRVHRPHRDGCTAELVARTTIKSEGSATFEFLGINGGAGIGWTTQLATKLAAGTICKEEVVPATLIVEHGATVINGKAYAYGTRYRIVDVNLSHRTSRQVPPEVDRCGAPPSPSPAPAPLFWGIFDKTQVPSGDADRDDETAKIGSTGYVTVGLGAEVPSTSLKLSVEMKRTLEWEFELTTTLKGGAKYLRFPVAPSVEQLPFEICWSVLT